MPPKQLPVAQTKSMKLPNQKKEEETAGDDTTADSVTLGTHTTSAEREHPMSDTESIATSMGTTMSLASLGTPRSREATSYTSGETAANVNVGQS